jgi:N-methylhydantoinase A/oxoprolinase/acetone carboxylase beta subunit
VAKVFDTELILPENYDVGNAIGAISSSVTEVVELSVRAAFQDFSDEPECTVYNGEDAFEFPDKDEAIEFAIEEATKIATKRAIESGASEVNVEHRVDETCIDVEGKGKKVFRGATVIVRASGKPMMHWFD